MNEFILQTIGLLAVVIAACVIVIRKKVLYRRAIVAGLVVIAVAGTGQLVSREGGALFSAGVDSQLERTFSRLPLYGVLKKQEPELWEKLHQQAVVMLKEGKDEQTVMDALQPQIRKLTMARLQRAPDDKVVAWMQENMRETAVIQKASAEACLRFLAPTLVNGENPLRYLPGAMLDSRTALEESVLNAAYGPGSHEVTEQERTQAQKAIMPIITDMMGRYGEDIRLIEDPHTAIGKENQYCDMEQDMWQRVLTLPQEKAAAVIRLALTQ